MPDEEKKLKLAIKNAEKLHGHLGPFLVIGVRMGKTAQKNLNTNTTENKLRATVKIPLSPPFSCVLDGIQAVTKCTVGNQKLKIENSQKEITARFETQNSNKTIQISVTPKMVEELMNKLSKGASDKKLAWKIAQMPESQLFTIEKQ